MQAKTDVDRLLMDSFKELALHTSIEKITIKEITDKAGVIRPTFYNHFQDKYEVIERIIEAEITNPVKVLLANEMITEAVTLIFSNMQKDKEFYLKLSRLQGQISFESIARKCIKNLLNEYVQGKKSKRQNKLVWFTQEHLTEYYAQSLSFIVLSWVQSGMSMTPREMAELYNYIMSHSMTEAINELY
jgi:AcrR family transcriptional regulator